MRVVARIRAKSSHMGDFACLTPHLLALRQRERQRCGRESADAESGRPAFGRACQKIELLRAKWPKAFPAKSHEVRPLTNGAQQAMVEEFGWSPDYARAVLTVWKLRPAYCNAILRYPTRINLDGSPSGEEIDDAARATATKRLEERTARQARKLAKLAGAEQQRLRAETLNFH